jgi:hypothetical protein
LASRLQARFEGYDADDLGPEPVGQPDSRPVPGAASPRKVQLQIDDLNHQLEVLRRQLDLAFDEFDQRLEASETRASVAEARASVAEARASVAEARASVAETRAHDAEAHAASAQARVDEALEIISDLMPSQGVEPTNLRSALDRLRGRLDVG